jgi:hypothetical protein
LPKPNSKPKPKRLPEPEPLPQPVPASKPEEKVKKEPRALAANAVPAAASGLLTAELKLTKKPNLKDADSLKGNVLGIFEYEIVEVRSGQNPGKSIEVAHGVVWNGKLMNIAKRDLGSTSSLDLVPLSEYPRLKQLTTIGGDGENTGAYIPKL